MAEVLNQKCNELGEHDFMTPTILRIKTKSWFLIFYDSTERDVGAVSICRRCGTQNRFWITYDNLDED